MRVRDLAIVGGISFVIFLMASVPLSAVIALINLDTRGITYARAEGSLWEGRLSGVAVRGQGLGNVDIEVNPWGLLLGRLDAHMAFDGSGAVSGQGRVILSATKHVSVEAFDVEADVGLLSAVIPLKGNMSVAVRRADFTAQGCRAAQVEVRTNALVDKPAGLNWSGPVLSGSAHCSDGALVIPLAGANGSETITASMQILPDGTFHVKINARTMDEMVISVLAAAGFVYAEGEMTLTQNGRWG
jgi:hypothetical protein